jgi:hypothetical protein
LGNGEEKIIKAKDIKKSGARDLTLFVEKNKKVWEDVNRCAERKSLTRMRI